MKPRGTRIAAWAPLAAVLAVLVAAWTLLPEFRQWSRQMYDAVLAGDREQLAALIRELGPWGPLAIVGGMTAQMFLLAVPSVLLMVVAILAYGPWIGSALALAAVLVAGSVAYALGRLVGPALVERLIGARTARRVEQYVDRYGLWTVIVFRLSPVFSNDAVSLVAGILGMGYWRFLAASVAGIAPLIGLIAGFGELRGGLRWLLIALSLLGAVFLAGYVVAERRRAV